MSESEFARHQLLKHGWTEGSGLGREETGIKEPIKVHVKNNKTGIGHDPGAEFTHHWWQDVFNKTASSIQVEATSDGSVTVSRNNRNKKTGKSKKKSTLYGSFIKGATLKQEDCKTIEEKEGSTSCSEEEEQTHKPSTKELFEECGGRTAHKGARHGLGMNGKLQRIEAMEQEFLLGMKTPNESIISTRTLRQTEEGLTKDEKSECSSTRRKKKKKKRKKDEEVTISDDCDEGTNQDHAERKKKKKKKKF